jgi:spore germination cell wall hydrolase CwlJ-like protein
VKSSRCSDLAATRPDLAICDRETGTGERLACRGLVALRQRRHQALYGRAKGRTAPVAVAVVVLMMPPARIGGQPPADATQSALGHRFRAHPIASPFGTIDGATFSFPQPLGTSVPAQPAAYLAGEGSQESTQRPFPDINRALKGPRLVPRVRADFDSAQASTIDAAAPSLQPQSVAPTATEASQQPQRTQPTNAGPVPDNPVFGALKLSDPEAGEQWMEGGDGASARVARIYFGTAPLGGTPTALEPWAGGKAPIFETQEPAAPPANMAMPFKPPRNETIAPKGEVTGVEHRPKSPAERLGLAGAARAKHEKCLADAIYFEARGEPIRGQMAVAQVVINRVFSGYYPHNICEVVYQNAHRRFRCQFTFACDGLPERVNEPVAWERAKHIAREALDGNFWLNDVGKATHYHARWVHPWWVHEMRRLDRIGVHTFYRPRNWGDGSNSPIWGDAEAPATAATAAKTL